MTAAPASDAEALSCAAAGRYAGRWARSVAALADEDRREPPAPWFVDGFAGADLQRAALRGATAQATAILAVQALDDAAAGRARVVLVEEDPGLIARLGDELRRMGAGDRLRVSPDPATAEPGEILLVEGAFASHAHRLAQRIGDGEPALVRLAPLAARALPWTALEPVIHLDGADVLVRFPREDFEKQGRFTGPLADLPPHLRRVVEGCSTFLDDARHGWLLAWRSAQRAASADAALATAVERLQTLLATAGEDRYTHLVHVQGKTESVHLLLSTPHAAHLAELDAALADGAARPKPAKRKATAPRQAEAPPPAATDEPGVEAAAASDDERPAPETAAAAENPPAADGPVAVPPESEASLAPAPAELTEAAEPAALDLFALAPQPEPAQRGPDVAAVANDLHARHIGARVPVASLLAGAADAGVSAEQVRAALASLKRGGRVSYRSLDAEGAEVEFLAEPRASAPRPRKPRAPAPEVLGLFDEPDE